MSKQCTAVLNCYVAKALPVTNQVRNCTQAMHAWHVAKTRLVNFLSTKVVNNLDRNFHGYREKLKSWNGAVSYNSHQSSSR